MTSRLLNFRRITDWLREKVSGDIAIVLGGNIFRLGIGLISSALLARGLTPEGFSVYAVMGGWVVILGTIADFGLRNSAIRQITGQMKDNESEALKFIGHFSKLKMFTALTVVAGIWIFAKPISSLIKLPNDISLPLIYLGGGWVLMAAFSGIPATLLQARRQFVPLIVSQSLNISLTVVFVAALFTSHRLTPVSALIVDLFTTLIGGIYALKVLPGVWLRAIVGISKWEKEFGNQLLRFGKWIWISTLFAIFYTQLDLLLLNRFALPRETGYYALAFNLAQKSLILFQTLYVVFLPQASGLANRGDLSQYLRKNIIYSWLMCGIVLLSVLIARIAVLLIYSSTYLPSVNLYYLLVIPVMIDLLFLPFLLLVYPLDVPRLEALGNGLRAGTLVVFGFLLIPRWGGYGAAIAKIISTFVGVAVVVGNVFFLIRRHHKFRLSPSDE